MTGHKGPKPHRLITELLNSVQHFFVGHMGRQMPLVPTSGFLFCEEIELNIYRKHANKNEETLSTILPSDSSLQLLSAFSMQFCKIPRTLCHHVEIFISTGYIVKLKEPQGLRKNTV